MTSIRIVDRKLNYVLAKAYIPDIVKIYFPEWDGTSNLMCPFHSDTNPSLNISNTGKAVCYGCGWSATNIIAFVAAMEDVQYTEARDMMYHELYNTIPKTKGDKFHKLLLKNTEACRYITKRGLVEKIRDEYNLGYDPHTGRISIPIYDQFKECVNIRYLGWKKAQRDKFKALNDKGHGNVRLYPEWKMVDEDVIILVEGEWDCLVGRRFDLPTVTWTGGADSWDKDYEWMFKGKHVLVHYDNDGPGRDGSKYAMERLKTVTTCEVLSPPSSRGKDLSDWLWLRYKGSITMLEYYHRAVFEASKGLKDKQPKRICPCCGQEMKDET